MKIINITFRYSRKKLNLSNFQKELEEDIYSKGFTTIHTVNINSLTTVHALC